MKIITIQETSYFFLSFSLCSLVGAAVACLLDDALLSIADCIEIGLKAARTSLGVAEAINPQLSLNALRSKLE